MKREEVIFFDIGQTLVSGMERSARRTLADRLLLTEKEVSRAGRTLMTCAAYEPQSLAVALEPILPRHEKALLRKALEETWIDQEESIRELPGAGAFLRALKEMGYRLGLISNTWHPAYQGFVRVFPEAGTLFDFQLLSYRKGFKKPEKALFCEAIRLAGVPADSCWMVGDSYELDMAPSLAQGMRALWILSRPEIERSILAGLLRGEGLARPHWTAVDFDEVLDFFRRETNHHD